MPQALQQAGGYLQQTEELKAHRAKAFDTLNAKTASFEARFPLQTLDAALLKADYQTYPDELEKQGHALIADRAKGLTPGARAIFTEDATQYLAVLHGRATQESSKRTEQAAAYTTSQTLYQAQDDYANATNDYEREVALGELRTTAQQMVGAGLVSGSAAATLVHKTVENAVKDRALVLNRTDPVGAYLDLKNIAEGGAAQHGELANIPRTLLPELMTDAQQQMHTANTQKEHAQKLAEAQLHQKQNANAITLRNDLMNIVPTPNNMAAIQLAKQHILDAGSTGGLSEPLHATLTNLAAGWEEKARTYTPVDDEPTKKHLLEVMTFATTPSEFDQVQLELYHSMPQLTGPTIQKIGQEIEARRGSLHPLNQEEAKAGRRLIMDTAMPGIVSFGSAGTNYMDVEEKTRLSTALNTYEQRILGLDAPHVRREAMGIAREVLKDFYEVPLGAPDYTMKQMKFLPLPIRRGGPEGKIVPTEDLVVSLYRNMHVPPEQAGHDLRIYRAWRASPEGVEYIQREFPEYITPPFPPREEPEAVPTSSWQSRPAAPTGPAPAAPASKPAATGGQLQWK